MKKYDEIFLERRGQSLKGLETSEFLSLLKSKVETAFTWEELESRLSERRPLNIKLGIDPTGAQLHLGHLVPMMLVDLFQKAGHHIDLVIGDFTAKVGDPSGRTSARPELSDSDIEKNFSTYTSQIKQYVDISKMNIRKNSEWLGKMDLKSFFAIIQRISLSEATQREDFRARAKNSQGVSLAEASYGVLMGIDSINLRTDVEIGGLDQLLNFQQCRKVMEVSGLPRESALTTPILEGISGDGKKMSKSFNNYIALNAPAEEKFGKIMSIPDNLISRYFMSFAAISEKERSELEKFIEENPLEAKKQLAVFLVSIGTGKIDDGRTERENFERRFSAGNITQEDAEGLVGKSEETVFEVLFESGQFASKSELKRLFKQKAVIFLTKTNGEKILSPEDLLRDNLGIVRVGKRKVYNLRVRE